MADDFDAIETGNEPKGRRGWLYVDDTGKEQGPYSTEKLRGWVAQGYLTASRVVRPFTSLPTDAKPLSEWSELAHGGAGAKKARARWKMARRVVSLAALHAKSMQDDTALVGLTRAQQQRYARSTPSSVSSTPPSPTSSRTSSATTTAPTSATRRWSR